VRDDAQAARYCEIEVTELMTGAIAIALLCGCDRVGSPERNNKVCAELDGIYEAAVELRDFARTKLGRAWLAQDIEDFTLVRVLASLN
jgi:hypothetical protein